MEEKAFEQWMAFYFDEPEWDEGYNRYDLYEAFQAGIGYAKSDGDVDGSPRNQQQKNPTY